MFSFLLSSLSDKFDPKILQLYLLQIVVEHILIKMAYGSSSLDCNTHVVLLNLYISCRFYYFVDFSMMYNWIK